MEGKSLGGCSVVRQRAKTNPVWSDSFDKRLRDHGSNMPANSWSAVQTEDGRTYYWNKLTLETSWSPAFAHLHQRFHAQ